MDCGNFSFLPYVKDLVQKRKIVKASSLAKGQFISE